MVDKVSVQSLSSRWQGRRPHLVTRLSFEDRSLVVASAIASGSVGRCTCFVSLRRSAMAEANLGEFRKLSPKALVVELDTSSPLSTANALYASLAGEVRETGLRDLVLDVTSFRREELLMLLAALGHLGPPVGTGAEVVYVGAEKMAERLSGQVKEFRSVLGYAGVMYPSRPTQLVVLMGFEFGRARSIIENYEPRTLLLGKGKLTESITPGLGKKNEEFYNELRSQYANVESTFEFSARDPLVVADELERSIKLDGSSNVIVAPLHTKLSTLGVGLFARRHPEVQVCYASVESYNEEGYSVSGKDAYVLSLDSLLLP